LSSIFQKKTLFGYFLIEAGENPTFFLRPALDNP